MGRKRIEVETVGEAYLDLLADRGVDYLFANSGTDFAPIIEPMCKPGTRYPKPITVPHENVAVSMAHGYYMVSGRPQAVMLHVSVGTANGICAIMNAARAQVPILFTAGRTPITEAGLTGSRDVPIHWPQEMFDQAGMLRELVKWEYELRNEQQLEAVVDRALNMAMSEPRGPVYLSLPREVLAQSIEAVEYDSPSRHQCASAPYPDPAGIQQAARMLAAAKRPLIITSAIGRDAEAVGHLAALAERYAIPVTQKWARTMNLPADHLMHLGYEPGPFLEDADLILVLDSDVPWIPSYQAPRIDCPVIHMGVDPLFSRYPIRSYRCDLAVTGVLRGALPALSHALAAFEAGMAADIAQRRERIGVLRKKQRDDWAARIERAGRSDVIEPIWISHCLDQVRPDDVIAAVVDLIAGHIQVMMPDLNTGLSHVKSGKIRPLAVFTKARSAEMPSVPTLHETVMPGFELLPWCGLSAPANLPPSIVQRLSDVLEASMKRPAVRERFLQSGVGPFWGDHNEFKAYVVQQLENWTALIKEADIESS